ncbi:hypothetical protein TNCV_609981 [Trichonephila clavipes]|nr:hypothetical protein TNCV_609981 [Trichonephila clavipes]
MVPLVQTARECIWVLLTDRTREADRDFCVLRMRRDERCVMDTPLVFKNVFRETERRALDGENLRRVLKERGLDGGGPRLEWKERSDER